MSGIQTRYEIVVISGYKHYAYRNVEKFETITHKKVSIKHVIEV